MTSRRLRSHPCREPATASQRRSDLIEYHGTKLRRLVHVILGVRLQIARRGQAETERQRAEEQLTRAEWLVCASKLMMAQTDFELGNGGLALHYKNLTFDVARRGLEDSFLFRGPSHWF